MAKVTAGKTVTAHPHIERKAGVCGGEPVIRGTRITVGLVAQLEKAGKTVDEIVALYPHLTHAQVYDALAYYYDNREEVDRYLREGSEAEIRKAYGNAPWLK
jgi:uncharacterized protein (DUF433 family)